MSINIDEYINNKLKIYKLYNNENLLFEEIYIPFIVYKNIDAVEYKFIFNKLVTKSNIVENDSNKYFVYEFPIFDIDIVKNIKHNGTKSYIYINDNKINSIVENLTLPFCKIKYNVIKLYIELFEEQKEVIVEYSILLLSVNILDQIKKYKFITNENIVFDTDKYTDIIVL